MEWEMQSVLGERAVLFVLGTLSFACTLAFIVFIRRKYSSTRSPVVLQSSVPIPSGASLNPVPRAINRTELSSATGKDKLWIAVKDPYGSETIVFDVSSGDAFYGPGAPYHLFVGHDATHGLAKSSMDPTQVEGDISGLTLSQKDTHMQWFAKYKSKYPQVGWLVDDKQGKKHN